MTEFKQLMIAIRARDFTHVRQAVLTGSDLTQRDERGWSPLLLAVEIGQLDIIKELVTAESINIPDALGRTPLWWAMYQRTPEITNVLLAQEGVDVNAADKFGKTPLATAAEKGNFEIVQSLLKVSDIDVNLADKWGETPLMGVVCRGHLDVLNALLDAGTDFNKTDNEGRTVLYYAYYFGLENYEVVRLLLQRGVNPNVQSYIETPLYKFALYLHIRTARLLIVAGADLYDLNEPNKPIIELVLKQRDSNRLFLRSDVLDISVLLYVALDDHDLALQSIQRLEDEAGEDEVGKKEMLKPMRDKLNDEEIVADVKKQLSDEKVEWIMHGLGGQNRILDVVMALKPMFLPTLVIIEMLMFDNPRLTEIPYHVVWDLVERIVRFTQT